MKNDKLEKGENNGDTVKKIPVFYRATWASLLQLKIMDGAFIVIQGTLLELQLLFWMHSRALQQDFVFDIEIGLQVHKSVK